MAKQYQVLSAWQSPGLDAWICPDTAELVGKLPEKERAHALKQGYIREIDVPTVEAAEAADVKRGGR